MKFVLKMNMQKKLSLYLVLMLASIANNIYAQQNIYSLPFGYNDTVINSQGGGYATMGGTRALLGNPAALGLDAPQRGDKKATPNEANFLSVSLYSNPTLFALLPPGIQQRVGLQDVHKFTDVLTRYKQLRLGVDLSTSYTIGGFGIGIYSATQLLSLEDDNNFVNTTLFTDFTTVLGYGYKTIPIITTEKGEEISLAVGIDLRPSYRITVQDGEVLAPLLVGDPLNISKLSTGKFALAGDLGLALDWDKGHRIGVALRDIGDTTYKYDDYNLVTPMTLVLGAKAMLTDKPRPPASESKMKQKDDLEASLQGEVIIPLNSSELIGYGHPSFIQFLSLGMSLGFNRNLIVASFGIHKGGPAVGLNFNYGIFAINSAFLLRLDNRYHLETLSPELKTELSIRY